MSEIWYYADQGKQIGPFTLEELRQKLADMPDARAILVWGNEFPDWKRASDVPEFRTQTFRPPPLPSRGPPPTATQEPAPPVDFPKGIAGWLVFPVLGTIISPFNIAYGLFQGWSVLANMPANTDPTFSMFAGIEFVFTLAMLVLWVVAMISAFRHKKWYPKLFVVLTAISLIGSIFDGYVGTLYNIPFEPDDGKSIIWPLISLVIWGPYMFISKRVRKTFIN
jgi:hypothetical protein